MGETHVSNSEKKAQTADTTKQLIQGLKRLKLRHRKHRPQASAHNESSAVGSNYPCTPSSSINACNIPAVVTVTESSSEPPLVDNTSNTSSDNVLGPSLNCNISESEDSESYEPGGYHPVAVGDVYVGRYRIEAKLGWGYFSTVWLATDLRAKPPCFVAIKIQRSSASHTETVADEIRILRKVRDEVLNLHWLASKPIYRNMMGDRYNQTRGVVTYLNHFEIQGPNGRHTAVVFEAMGPNLLSLIKLYKFQGIPMYLVKKIAVHVLIGLVYLHSICGVIHTDLKPENILVSSILSKIRPRLDGPLQVRRAVNATDSRASSIVGTTRGCIRDRKMDNKDSNSKQASKKVKSKGIFPKPPIFIDTQKGPIQIKPTTLDCFCHPDAVFKICDLGNACWINRHFSEEIQTRQYRSPEAILLTGYSHETDIWSLACIIFELVTGDYLFDPKGQGAFQRDTNHLQLIVELLGPIPIKMFKSGKKANSFDVKRINKTRPWPLDSVLIRKYHLPVEEARNLSEFLLCMLKIDTTDRPCAQEVLQHPWLYT